MKKYFQKTTSAAPLAIFRIALGILLFGSIARFWANGWIYELYIEPKHFFPFYGFEFITPLGQWTYVLFAICAISALLVAAGLFYRVAAVSLFVSFTYIELIDKSTYLNHYYFISMICLMMIFLPAHAFFSVDAHRNEKIRATHIPQWCIDSLKVFVCVVYVYAGLAKMNSDWLLNAHPLRIWLPAKNDLPVIGWLFNYVWVAFAFSWLGCLYDLTIPFFLLKKTTRAYAYAAVIVFHVLTAILFPIGMFPYIMIATALIFFSADFHLNIIQKISGWLKITVDYSTKTFSYSQLSSKALVVGFAAFLIIQTIVPFRYIMYPGELFWTEEGYRFSWRVMLMEKAGYAQFVIKDSDGNQAVAENREFLTPLQEKMMATQPDMILQYAQILSQYYSDKGFKDPEVYIDSYVALNGRLGKPLIDPQVNLAKEKDSFKHKTWILPFNNDIKGF